MKAPQKVDNGKQHKIFFANIKTNTMKTYQQLISFIRSTFHEPSEFIPLHDPRFIGNERNYLLDAMDTNFVSSVGEYVGRFERMCAEYTGAV